MFYRGEALEELACCKLVEFATVLSDDGWYLGLCAS